MFCVYKYTSPSGKSYIGQTNNVKRRATEHKNPKSGCRVFNNAIKKYGWNNFLCEILIDDISINESNYWEEYYIEKYNTLAPNGYNLNTGGNSKTPSDDTRIKLKEFQSNKILNEDTKQKISNTLKGHQCLDETKQKISSSLTGRFRLESVKQKISKTCKGKIKTEQHKQNLRKPKQQVCCPYCGKIGGISSMMRWHFNNCKQLKEEK